MTETAEEKAYRDFYQTVKNLPSDDIMHLSKWIKREREFVVGCNYAYDVIGISPVPDYIYDYVVKLLIRFEKYCPEEWFDCKIFFEYFVENDDWKYTGSGVPRTIESESLAKKIITKWTK